MIITSAPATTAAKLRRLLSSRRLAIAAIMLGAAATAILATTYLSPLAYVERFTSDLRVAEALPPEPQQSDVIVVAITEETLQQFPYRSPIDRRFLSRVLKLLEERGVRGIGIDILLDQATEPEKDDLLHKTLDQLKVPLVAAYVRDPEIVNEQQRQFLDAYLPPRLRGLANLAKDTVDGTVRWIYPGQRQEDGAFLTAFDYALAARLGKEVAPRQIEIAWHGRPNREAEPFRVYDAHLIEKLPARLFKDKVVLIGAEVSLTDRHRTPFDVRLEGHTRALSGVMIRAHMIAQLLEGREVARPSAAGAFALALVAAALGGALGAVSLPLLVRLGASAALVIGYWTACFLAFHYNRLDLPLVSTTMAFALAAWAVDSLGSRSARKQREFIKSAFSRYVSPKIVDHLIRHPEALSLRGDRHDMTFLFTDVEGFTTMAESIEAEALGPLMNAYFEGLCSTILRYEGTVDKFIGDAIFAIFNAPAAQPDHAERAIRCALEIDHFAQTFRREQAERGVKFGNTRVGVHTGRALVGNFGTSTRMEYTALGDAVNTAARLEGTNKIFGTRVLASETTRLECHDFAFRPLGRVALKGKTKTVTIFEPLGPEHARSTYMARYNDAYEALARGEPCAGALFRALLAERPDDRPVAFYCARIASGAEGVEIGLG